VVYGRAKGERRKEKGESDLGADVKANCVAVCGDAAERDSAESGVH
jgi:hypothetical protein